MRLRWGSLVWLAVAAGACQGRTESGQSISTACTSDRQCPSEICGVDGTGYCCNERCATADPICAATGCDKAGACLYPATGLDCTTCSGATLSVSACNGAGACVPSATHACPDGLLCNDAGTACRTDCASSLDCAAGFYCSDGGCEPLEATGPCTANAQCLSGVCGLSGTGNCCASPCTKVSGFCGATGCDPTSGACVYLGAGVECGPSLSCVGSTETTPGACDGLGDCVAHSTSCAPYICNAGVGCLKSCQLSGDCVPGSFCDQYASQCCPGFGEDILQVDAVLGSDAVACCGYGDSQPCQTLTHAMGLVGSSDAQGVTLHATVDGGGGDWPDGIEPFPIRLDGFELNAPGVFFAPPDPGGAVFAIDDTASISGTTAAPVGIGVNQAGTAASNCYATIDLSGGLLYLANALIGNHGATSVEVENGGLLMLGQDWGGEVEGTVYIGNDLNQEATNGFTGISCFGADTSPCIINDGVEPRLRMSSVVIQGQEGPDLFAIGPATISLVSAPVFGQAPSAPGFGTCAAKGQTSSNSPYPEAAVLFAGDVTAILRDATVQCSAAPGIEMYEPGGGPSAATLELDDSLVQNTMIGLAVVNGTAVVSSSTIQFNVFGVQQYDDAVVDLSGGDAGGMNTIICSSGVEADAGDVGAGVANYSYSQQTLNAENVAWDTAGPDLFSCDQGSSYQQPFVNCACLSSSCAVSPGADGMDAVETYDSSSFLTPIDTAGATQSPTAVANGCK